MLSPIFILAQALGLIIMCMDIYAAYQKADKKLIRFHGYTAFLWSIHFFLLGGFTGAFAEIFNGIRLVLASSEKVKKHSHYISVFFLIIYAAMLLFIPDNLVEALPFIASLVLTVGVFYFSGLWLRISWIITFTLWFIYSAYTGSLGGMILESTLICTNFVTIYRLIKDKAKEKLA